MSPHVPRLSIGMPAYNSERFLRGVLDSILGQSFGDFELLVSDNASTDATGEIAQEVARRDRRVRYWRNAINIGSAGNFCAVFRHARAPLFKWSCSDDALAPGFLDAAVRELDASPQAVLCYGQVEMVDADGHELGPHAQGLDLRAPDPAERFRTVRHSMGMLNVLQGVMRADALRRTGLYGAFPGSDWVLVAELALHGTLHEIPAPMLERRLHPQASSAARTVRDQLDHLDPTRRDDFSPWFWRHSLEHLKSVARSPLPARSKLALTVEVARDMFQIRDLLGRELRRGLAHLTARSGSEPARGE